VIGASSEPAAKPGTITAPKQFGRRGTPRGVAPSAANGQEARPAIGVVEDPSQLTEKLSGDRAQSAAPAREDRPRREPREPRPEGLAEEGRQPGIPQGDRPRREPRAEGERGPRREAREPRPEGDRGPRREDRPRREERPRIQIEPVVIPVQAPIGFWASLKRKLATLFGIPDKAVFVPSSRPYAPRGEPRGERSDRGHRGGRGRGEFRGGSRGGRDGSRGGRGEFRGDRGPRNGPREG
jgi:hypothetical protein